MLSERANRIALSPTLRINARATQMRGQGIDVVDFSVGEPDFPTPEVVKRAAKAALDANFTKYTANDGIPDLKQAICGKLERDNGLAYSPDEVIVSAGAKNSLFNVAMALYDEGDDILIPAPYWVSYPDQVKLAKANPVVVPTREEDGFRLQARDLAAAITPNTKAIILNYPCNPTGATYTREQLEEIADVCVREQIWVISDEIYEKLIYDGQRFVSIASVNDKIKKLTVVINGFSKAFSMTGWRLGYAAGPREIVAACSKIQSHNTSNATSFVQKAAVTALAECDMDVERMRQEFERRRNAIVYRLRSLPEVSCASPSGAFYVMPNVTR
jgi:aspartate aminotransferase